MTTKSHFLFKSRLRVIVLIGCGLATGVPPASSQGHESFTTVAGDYDLVRHEGYSLPASLSGDAGSPCGQDGKRATFVDRGLLTLRDDASATFIWNTREVCLEDGSMAAAEGITYATNSMNVHLVSVAADRLVLRDQTGSESELAVHYAAGGTHLIHANGSVWERPPPLGDTIAIPDLEESAETLEPGTSAGSYRAWLDEREVEKEWTGAAGWADDFGTPSFNLSARPGNFRSHWITVEEWDGIFAPGEYVLADGGQEGLEVVVALQPENQLPVRFVLSEGVLVIEEVIQPVEEWERVSYVGYLRGRGSGHDAGDQVSVAIRFNSRFSPKY